MLQSMPLGILSHTATSISTSSSRPKCGERIFIFATGSLWLTFRSSNAPLQYTYFPGTIAFSGPVLRSPKLVRGFPNPAAPSTPWSLNISERRTAYQYWPVFNSHKLCTPDADFQLQITLRELCLPHVVQS